MDGRVQIGLSVLGRVLREHFLGPDFQDSNGALAELFRSRPDRPRDVKFPEWDGEQRHVFVLGADSMREEVAAMVSGAMEYWSCRAAGEVAAGAGRNVASRTYEDGTVHHSDKSHSMLLLVVCPPLSYLGLGLAC